MYESVSKKIKNASERLFDHYQKEMQANGIPGFGSLQRFQMVQVGHILKTISELEMKTIITCAVKYWDYLRSLDKDGEKLENTPNFYQMLARWRYKKWQEIFEDPEFQQKYEAFKINDKELKERESFLREGLEGKISNEKEDLEKMIEDFRKRVI